MHFFFIYIKTKIFIVSAILYLDYNDFFQILFRTFGCLSRRRLWTCFQNFVVIKSIVWTLKYRSHSFCTFHAWKQFHNFDTISLIIFSSSSVLGQQLTHRRHLAWAAQKAYIARSIQSEQWYHQHLLGPS